VRNGVQELSLKSQRRIATKILKAGEGRVWIDPNRNDDVEAAITRSDIRRLIHEGAIKKEQKKGVSHSRALVTKEKKSKGLRRGPGVKSGAAHADISKKEAWMKRIRALRKEMRELKAKRRITETSYRQLYDKANGGVFESIADMERYIETQGLWRRR
jgi:large subunit ribosomal protein L19e